MDDLYIVDLDGTLADIEHRRPILDDESIVDEGLRWRNFFAACVDDTPNRDVIKTVRALHKAGAEIWVWSARSSEVELETLRWLEEYLGFSVRLKMRASGDRMPDPVMKHGWLMGMNARDRARLVAVFDDRDTVVAMWRKAGIRCYQVAYGDF